MEEMLQRRGNMQNVPFSSHVAQVAFSPIILSSALLILFPFPAEFNPVSIFCTLTQAQKRACEHTHTHTHTHTHPTMASAPAFGTSVSGREWAHLPF